MSGHDSTVKNVPPPPPPPLPVWMDITPFRSSKPGPHEWHCELTPAQLSAFPTLHMLLVRLESTRRDAVAAPIVLFKIDQPERSEAVSRGETRVTEKEDVAGANGCEGNRKKDGCPASKPTHQLARALRCEPKRSCQAHRAAAARPPSTCSARFCIGRGRSRGRPARKRPSCWTLPWTLPPFSTRPQCSNEQCTCSLQKLAISTCTNTFI